MGRILKTCKFYIFCFVLEINLYFCYYNLRLKSVVFTSTENSFVFNYLEHSVFLSQKSSVSMFTGKTENMEQIPRKQCDGSNHLIHYDMDIVINHNIQRSVNPQFCEKNKKKKGIKLSVSLLKKEEIS